MPYSGSSPLTRGARPQVQTETYQTRIIPAHAGSTFAFGCKRRCGPDHPRSRGEHRKHGLDPDVEDGSSPLTRGAPQPRPPSRTQRRIIPAHAGSTTTRPALGASSGDHPRSRGEHRAGHLFRSWMTGSSPLTRGAPTPGHPNTPATRIIPAHAGSTSAVEITSTQGTDHPRSRGEHATAERASTWM